MQMTAGSPRADRDLAFRVNCACGWEWREIVANEGLSALERFCPRCTSHSLVVFRNERPIGVVPIAGRNESGLWEALRAVGDLTTDEVATLYARAVGSPARKANDAA